ncbi:aromatic ring-hydroxylating dioxygenase subunit alpha [Pseudohalocynthiibacter aestuariivivens]|nr:aromatic ring-hydroxylating dioxygenase subunit alpha [Pseudohalocynthiibacter aestuariivivens]QIE44563.1 aromatic ring-hydroxylating dioxygenase subunit alpha [Pseudohalocynthiibacter aestuariivivens]
MTTAPPADLRDLIGSCQSGFALPRPFYTRPDIYEHDIAAYWNHSWIWVGHVCQIPEPGDYFLFDYAQESLIITRNRAGDVCAYLNICRHRGSRVCTEAHGNTRLFVCPYHAWSYDLNGQLRGGREMGPDFDPSQYGLFKAHLRVFEGMIFVCPAEIAPVIDTGLERLRPLAAPFGLDNLRIAHSASYPVPANWKLAVENYMECYHCAPSHKDYSRSHSLKDPASMTPDLLDPMRDKGRAAGLPDQIVSLPNTGDHGMNFYYRRYPLYPGYQTGSQTGTPLAPLLGTLTGYDGGTTDLQIGILNNFLIYSDHVVGYRFVPRALQQTDIQIVWYVRGDAQEGRDYDRAALTWLWHVTSLDDERIIRINQEGVNAHRFVPGPLSQMEWGVQAFYDHYLTGIGHR